MSQSAGPTTGLDRTRRIWGAFALAVRAFFRWLGRVLGWAFKVAFVVFTGWLTARTLPQLINNWPPADPLAFTASGLSFLAVLFLGLAVLQGLVGQGKGERSESSKWPPRSEDVLWSLVVLCVLARIALWSFAGILRDWPPVNASWSAGDNLGLLLVFFGRSVVLLILGFVIWGAALVFQEARQPPRRQAGFELPGD